VLKDIPSRAAVSQDVNKRLMDNLAVLQDANLAGNIIGETTKPLVKEKRRYRALDPIGKDLEILRAISIPSVQIAGMTKKMLRQNVMGTNYSLRRTEKQVSAKISRQLQLLRVHGIIRKLPRQNRHQLTFKTMWLTTMLPAILAVSTENLLKMAV
jgi:hypothetical protein